MHMNKFEYKMLPCHFDLVNNDQVIRFCDLLIKEYLKIKEDGTE